MNMKLLSTQGRRMSTTIVGVLLAALALATSRCHAGSRGVLFTSPKVWLAGSDEKVCVSLHNINFDITCTVELRLDDEETPRLTERAVFSTDGCMEMHVPKDNMRNKGTVYFRAESVSEDTQYMYNGTATVGIQVTEPLTFVQTDKPIYKPGQTVRFRVLSLDSSSLKPILGQIAKVWIEDPNNMRMEQWINVSTEIGLASLDMALSEEPIQGVWKVTVDGAQGRTVQTFKVEEYVLPKYEIVIKPMPYVMINAETVEAEVCAHYTYGEPVRGLARVVMCITGHANYPFSRRHMQRPCTTFMRQIVGCEKFQVAADDLELSSSHYSMWNARLKVNVTLEESGTGVQLNATNVDSKVERTLFTLKFDSPDYFKPGLDFIGKLVATQPDGMPAPNAKVRLTLSHYTDRSKFQKQFTSNANGVILFSLPTDTLQQGRKSYSIEAQVVDKDQAVHPGRHKLSPIRAYHSVKQWYSPSASFLQIQPIDSTAQCGHKLTVNITYTTQSADSHKFYYKVISRGNIVLQGHKKHDSKGQPRTPDQGHNGSWNQSEMDHYNYAYMEPLETNEEESRASVQPTIPSDLSVAQLHLDIHVDSSIAGGARLIVYYVRRDGEVVADSTDFNTDKCLQNQAALEFLDKSRYPGDNVRMRLSADPGSLCAYGVVDKSVHLLGGNNRLSLKKVFEYLNKYKLSGNPSKPWDSSQEDAYCKANVRDEYDFPPLPPLGPMPMEARREKRSVRYPGWNSYYSKYYDSSQAFKGVDLVVVSDMELQLRPCIKRNHRRRSRWRKMESSNNRRRSRLRKMKASRSRGDEQGQNDCSMDLIVLGDMMVNMRPCERRPHILYHSSPMSPRLQSARGMPDLPGMPGAVHPQMSENEVGEENVKPVVELRNYFPETWLWDIQHIGDSGVSLLRKTLPHTITEWIGSSVCTNSQTGLGLSTVTKVKAFQPFFVSFTLPYSVVRGETVHIPVTVFNYLSECLVVSMTLKSNRQFKMAGSPRKVEFCVCGQESQTHIYSIVPRTLGSINVTVKAQSVDNAVVCDNMVISPETGARDAVTRELLVEAEGREDEYSHSAYICTQGEGHTENADLTLPTDLVSGSARGYVTVIGDVMGAALSGLDKLLRLPTGCGEQNMLKFAPNIFILQYLTSVDEASEDIKQKALGFLRTGYQRELQYRHDDGSYSAFGNSDPVGSLWLSAFVTKSFGEAKQFIFIDSEDLSRTMSWLQQHQLENGCFPMVGKVLHKGMKGGLASGGENPATLTAYVLIAMLEAGASSNASTIQSAVQCIEAQTVSDAYTTALVAYAYSLLERNSVRWLDWMKRLDELAISQDGLTHWSDVGAAPAPTPGGDGWHPVYHVTSAEVEMSAYALLARVTGAGVDAVGSALPVVRWLSAQRNPNGGFKSTQDTVVALQALARFASLVSGEEANNDVHLSGTGVFREFHVDRANSLVLQTQDVILPNRLSFNITGTGCVLLQANVRYNVKNVTLDAQPTFQLRAHSQRHPSNDCKKRHLHICTKYVAPDGASNMAVVSVKMVSGSIPVKESVKVLQNDAGLQLKRADIEKNVVNFYFDEITGDYKCFHFAVEQHIEVDNAKPGLVHVYDYYETEKAEMMEYSIRRICGTKEEIPLWKVEDGREWPDIEQRRMPLAPPGLGEQLEADNPAQKKKMCPRCEDIEDVASLKELFCQSAHAYKAKLRGSRTWRLKISHDIRQSKKVSVYQTVKPLLPADCQCDILKNGEAREQVLILTTNTTLVDSGKGKKRSTLILDGDSVVSRGVPSMKGMERALRTAAKQATCIQ